jgi:replication factor C subunit 2/4
MNNDIFNYDSNEIKPVNIKLPWIEKYRPKNTDEVLLDPFIKEKINKMIETKTIPNMIITGEPGTGKTSTILFLAKYLYNEKYNDYVLELNASDDRGLTIINNTIYPFCKKKIDINYSYKLVILDEADSITQKAQNLLSNVISKFRKNTRFVFICNDYTQIIESIQSKCMIIKYPKIDTGNLYFKIKNICENENVEYTEEGINTLIFVSEHDIRQLINNLECIYYTFGKLNEENIYKFIDKPKTFYISEILKACFNKDYPKAINIIKNLYIKGYTPNDILLTFMKYLFEYENNLKLEEETKLKLYEIISLSYIVVNSDVDTLLQLCGCISKVYLYIQSKNHNNIIYVK